MISSSEAKISIRCDNCGTKYRVHESRFSEKVSKVKCTKCKTVFKFQKLPSASSQNSGESEELDASSCILSDAEKAYFEATGLKSGEKDVLPAINLESAKGDESPVEPGSSLAKGKKDYENSFVSNVNPESPKDSEAPTPSASSTVPAHISEDSETKITSSEQSRDFSFQFPESPLSLVEEIVKPPGINWGKKTIALLTFMVVFTALLVASIYLILKEPSLVDHLLNPREFPVHFGGELDSKQVRNFTSRQTLFVVEGKLRNLLPTSDQVGWIQLKGLAFDENRRITETSVVYAGNVLTEQEISSWSLEKIRDFYTYKSGRQSSNFKLNEKQEVPFQMIFFESANVVKNVTVRPISYIRQNKIEYIRAQGQ